jgi:hypothetical protein
MSDSRNEPKNEAIHTEQALDTKDAEIVLENGKAETVLHDELEIDPVFEKKTMYVYLRHHYQLRNCSPSMQAQG